MVKTQVQIPDRLYSKAKRIAKDYEMSFAEVVRRGLERISEDYPEIPVDNNWTLPSPKNLGVYDLDDDQLKNFAQEDGDISV